ncbi:MAG: hypothetical protein AAFQ82_14955, partial [Myxococcota bacterium]
MADTQRRKPTRCGSSPLRNASFSLALCFAAACGGSRQSSETPEAQCDGPSDCTSGICTDGMCVDPSSCTSNAQCPVGWQCSEAQVCVAPGTNQCTLVSDCASVSGCEAGGCECVAGRCENDNDCTGDG